MAMGVFEGHMAKMSQGFKAVRIAEALLAEKLDHPSVVCLDGLV